MLLQELLPGLDLKILALDRLRPGTWWSYRKVNSTYNRLFLVHDGEAFVRHHGREYRMTRGMVHVVPCFTNADYFCRDSFDLSYVAFDSRLTAGFDVLQSRVMEAQIRLATTVKPIKTIAFELGFASPQYFARVFKARVGVSPTTYRDLQTRTI